MPLYSPPSSGGASGPSVNAIGNSVASQAIDWSTGDLQTVILNVATTTFTFTGAVAGRRYVLRLKQDATGGRLAVWPASVRWAAGAAGPVLTAVAGKTDYIGFNYDPTDAAYDGVAVRLNF